MSKSRTAAADSIKKYNAAYSVKKDFVARPNAFLKRCLDQFGGTGASAVHRRAQAGRLCHQTALDIGLGQGRNALLLAQRGYDVTGIDRSEVGIRAAVRMAAARGFRGRINAVIADTERFEYGRNRWDLIVLLYYPQPMFLIDRLKSAVRPGGHIVVERFSRPNHGKAAHLVDRRETKKPSPMLECFADWHVLHYEHDEFDSDWHWDGESPRGPIVRLLARKPWRLTK
jgi:2-polyprenyl-3-methyl-5-hydroxy-6-metoxy-1,4-benzoquinol methylase